MNMSVDESRPDAERERERTPFYTLAIPFFKGISGSSKELRINKILARSKPNTYFVCHLLLPELTGICSILTAVPRTFPLNVAVAIILKWTGRWGASQAHRNIKKPQYL
jgi:hypothetical protein